MAKYSKGIISYAEGLLYHFPSNLMRLHEAQYELIRLRRMYDVHAQNYDAPHTARGTHSDPVAARSHRILTLEELAECIERKTVPVLQLRNELKNSADERCRVRFYIMELHYFEDMPLVDVMIHLQKRNIAFMRHERRIMLEQLVSYIKKISHSR